MSVKLRTRVNMVFAVLWLATAIYTWVSGQNIPYWQAGILFLLAAILSLQVATLPEKEEEEKVNSNG